ncbi:MAG: response regulator transcription factor [Bacteriovoracaceae bacterium]
MKNAAVLKSHGISVCIVDDDRELCEGLEWIINSAKGYSCLGVFYSGKEFIMHLLKGKQALPDVVVMDIEMKNESGIDCVREVRSLYPEMKIIMQTVFNEDEKIFRSLKAGAVGYILKNSTKEKLLDAVYEAHHGGAPMTGSVARRVLTFLQSPPNPSIINTLSDREQNVLELLVRGLSYKKIGTELFISPSTVRHHLHNIYQKLHVRSRGEAVAKAQGLHH